MMLVLRALRNILMSDIMKVKISGKLVEVLDKNCPKRNCFYYGHYTHHSAAGYSGCSSWTDSELSCLRRDNVDSRIINKFKTARRKEKEK